MALVDVAVRPGIGENTLALLKSILQASNTGILLTDLEHRSLACNGKFGQFFQVDPATAVSSGVEELRSKVFPLLHDQGEWIRKLDLIYADPHCVYEDDLVLGHEPKVTLHRYTAPVCDAQEQVIGRLWTFTDVTQQRRRQRMSDVLHFVSTLYDPDPKAVYRRILKEVSDYYSGATALLSILENDFLVFRGIEGAPSNGRDIARQMRGNMLGNSYCQFILKSADPLIIQDAAKSDLYCSLPPSSLGLNRYLGVPVHDPSGGMVGTLCILDEKTNELLDEEDVRFMTLLSMRVSTELAREAHLAERLAEHVSAISQTRGVLSAMNAAFSLLASLDDTDELVRSQVAALKGVLGFSGCCVLLCEGDSLVGYTAKAGQEPVKTVLPRACAKEDSEDLKRLLSTKSLVIKRVVDGEREIALIAFGSEEAIDLTDDRLSLHLEALFDQVDLLVRVHLLHRDLTLANTELVQSEKLGVVGALAAATAHDIRNIMSALDIELASTREATETLASVRQQTARFSVLAHRLLSYAKPTAQTRSLASLQDVLDSVVALLAGHLRISNVSVKLCLPSKCLVRVDSGQLEHVFINLFLNSIQAMPSGGTITVDVLRKGKTLRLTVSDTGKGLDSGLALFEPFSSSRANGFGLGLYSCQRIIEEHGGTIGVASEAGKGTTFTIVLPTEEGS